MSLRKVPRAQWAGVLERFSREHRAWLATVLQVQGDVQATRAEALPLRSIELQDPACLAIRFADDSEVRIEAPRVLRLDETAEGADRGFDVESPEGVTRLRFRVTAAPEALDGIAPAER